MAAVIARPFRLALVQLGSITANKAENLKHAREMVLKAAGAVSKPQLIVLPECFNSPYGHQFFPQYAETIGYRPGTAYDAENSPSESVRMLSAVAKQTGTWSVSACYLSIRLVTSCTGS